MNTKYINIHIKILEEFYDLSYAYLSDYPFLGVEERKDELVISFNSAEWNDQIKNEMMEKLRSIHPNIHIIEEVPIRDQNWNEEWEKNVPAIVVNNRIGIAPAWKIDELKTDIKLVINPKMSFGTGEHETTKMVCRMMEGIVKPGSSWIDVGSGTGVLSILAIKLGARKALAFDNDEWSVNNSIENIELNQIDSGIEVRRESIDDIALPKADGIAANLFIHLLAPNLGKMYQSLMNSQGDLIISGVLLKDSKGLIKSAEREGFSHIITEEDGEWSAIHFKAGRI